MAASPTPLNITGPTTSYAVDSGRYAGTGDRTAATVVQKLEGDDSRFKSLDLHDHMRGKLEKDSKGIRAIIKVLRVNSTLTSLNLHNCDLHSDGEKNVGALAEMLRSNSTLISLDLSHNCLGKTDGSFIHIAEALAVNSSLRYLNLKNNSLKLDAICGIFRALNTNSTLTHLDLSECDLRTHPRIPAEIFQNLNNFALTSLTLASTGLRAGDAIPIARALISNSTLTDLNLKRNHLEGDDVSAFAEALKVNSTLLNLDLGYALPRDQDAEVIAEALKVNSSLTRLNLTSGRGILLPRQAALTPIIEARGAEAIAEALTTNSSLKRLDLKFNKIGNKGSAALAKALSVNSSLERLDLQSNGLGEDDVTFIAKALTTNSRLTHLDLKFNHHFDSGPKALAEALTVNFTLTNLEFCLIKPVFSEVITQRLERNKKISESQVSLQERCFKALSRTVVQSYSKEEKNNVYYQIWVHSGKPNEFGFGEKNVFNVSWQIFLKSVHDAGFDLRAGVEMLMQEKGVPLWLAQELRERVFTIETKIM